MNTTLAQATAFLAGTVVLRYLPESTRQFILELLAGAGLYFVILMATALASRR